MQFSTLATLALTITFALAAPNPIAQPIAEPQTCVCTLRGSFRSSLLRVLPLTSFSNRSALLHSIVTPLQMVGSNVAIKRLFGVKFLCGWLDGGTTGRLWDCTWTVGRGVIWMEMMASFWWNFMKSRIGVRDSRLQNWGKCLLSVSSLLIRM